MRPIQKEACRVREVWYMGVFQGMQVTLRGEKFPRQKGHVYATSSVIGAVESAFREKAGLPAGDDKTKPIAEQLGDDVGPHIQEAVDQRPGCTIR